MKCPFCNSKRLKTTDSRRKENYTRRRKVCESCDRSFATEERAVLYRRGTDEIEEYYFPRERDDNPFEPHFQDK